MEFWATWCSGCVAAIPHLNSLAESFKDKPIRFISITDEDGGVVQWFLGKRPISGWVAVDKTGVTFRKYGVEGRPTTVLIDAKGIYRGQVSANELTGATLNALLAGTFTQPEPTRSQIVTVGTEPDAPPPLVQVLIRPAMSVEQVHTSPGLTRHGEYTWEAWGFSLKRLLAYCSNVSEARIIVPHGYERQEYDVLITLPNGDNERRKQIIQEALETTFQSQPHRERRDMDVYVLRRAKDAAPRLEASDDGKSVGSYVAQFEYLLHTPVLDDSGLSGKYKFVWEYRTKLADINAQLRAILGLELVADHRAVEVLLFESNATVQ